MSEMRELHEQRIGTYRSPESDGTDGICCGPSDKHKNSHRFPSSKRKQQNKGVEIEMKQKCRMYYTTMLSPSLFLPVSLR